MTINLLNKPHENPLVDALQKCKLAFIITFAFSFGVNLLGLITTVYALQVLDRVLGSGSLSTLGMISLVIFIIYVSQMLLQVARSFTLIKVGEWMDKKVSPLLFTHAVSVSALKQSMGASQIIREFANIKSFLTSIGINSLFDAPWSIIYIAALFLIHSSMGWLTVFAVVIALFMAFLNAYAIDLKLKESSQYSIQSHYMADLATRNAETVQALGMMGKIRKKWETLNDASLFMQSIASYRNGIISNFSRFFRSIISMAVTGLGAYIVIESGGKDLTSGYMIASSILVSKALYPFDQAVEVWKQAYGSFESYKKIKAYLDAEIQKPKSMSIPSPTGRILVENVFFAPPAQPGSQQTWTLRGINFSLEPGTSLAIIGPSAAGKSTLARLLVGIWKPATGNVRLDGMDVFAWDKEDLGKHIGYVPQDIALFSGSVKENISRMDPDPDPGKIIEAAQIAGAHDMITKLPNAYETDIGLAGSSLSGGQKQRVALARAFYGNPKFVVLDEPNANLDEKGEMALVEAIKGAKQKGITSILISHRPSILAFVDMIMIVQDGMVAAFGTREEIMAKFAQQNPGQPQQGTKA